MPGRPLLVVDGDSFAHRAYHGLPKTILGVGGKPACAIVRFATFLLTDPGVREAFLAFHAELLDARWWLQMQEANRDGRQIEVLSYPEAIRFRRDRARKSGAVAAS